MCLIKIYSLELKGTTKGSWFERLKSSNASNKIKKNKKNTLSVVVSSLKTSTQII